MSQNFRETAHTHAHARQTGSYFLGSYLMYMNRNREKLFFFKTKNEVYCFPFQENVMISHLKKKKRRRTKRRKELALQTLGVATWNLEKKIRRCLYVFATERIR